MQTSRFLVAIFVASASLSTVRAQTTPAEQDKLLEVLRQKVAEERANMSAAPETPGSGATKPEAATPRAEIKEPIAPSPSTKTGEAAQSPAVRRMLEVLRAAVAKERAAEASQTGAPAMVGKTSKTKPAAKEKAAVRTTAPPREAALAPPAPEQNAGPKTKQGRLVELLERYNADKLTPHEYHEQRAKILAEP